MLERVWLQAKIQITTRLDAVWIDCLGFNAVLIIFHITAASSPTRLFPGLHTPVIYTTYFPATGCFSTYTVSALVEDRRMNFVSVTYVKRPKECWPSWGSNSQPMD